MVDAEHRLILHHEVTQEAIVGNGRILVGGVRGEMALARLAHNFKRVSNVLGIPALMSKLAQAGLTSVARQKTTKSQNASQTSRGVFIKPGQQKVLTQSAMAAPPLPTEENHFGPAPFTCPFM